MALQLREVTLRLGEEETLLPDKVALTLAIPSAAILSWTIVRKGIDARRKPDVLRVYTIEFSVADEPQLLARHNGNPALVAVPAAATIEIFRVTRRPKILVVGTGPAGLFSALQLVEAGAEVILVERGKPVAERLRDVQCFWAGKGFDAESNIQFGEGGAGTFSDGKLTSRLIHPLTRRVLETLVRFGAPEEILRQAKPHVGSDRLRSVLIKFREDLLAKGVDIRFSARLTGLELQEQRVCAGVINASARIACDQLILAPGHSARDTYRMLHEAGVFLEAKPFAIGLRVEHPLELINRIQYGREKHAQLPAAEYSLAWNDRQSGRGIYSFCMCPGGMVVNAASEQGGIVVNGMSNYRRDAELSNAALVVSVRPDDFSDDQVLAGIAFQRHWERAAFRAGGGNWRAPAQPLLEFLGRTGGRLRSSCRPQVAHADLADCLPAFVVAALRRALPYFDKRMRGFVGPEATLIGVETRTSAPLRIVRNQRCESLSHSGLYPAGEGAGYAGGIMSAALDGLRVANQILERYR